MKEKTFSIFGVSINISIYSGNKKSKIQVEYLRKCIEFLITRFPQYKLFYNPMMSPDELEHLYDTLNLLIGSTNEESKETHYRNTLSLLRKKATFSDVQKAIDEEIAKSNLISGIPDRALTLKNEEVKAQCVESDKAYESIVPLLENMNIWKSMIGDVRGRSLVYLFKNEEDLLRKKKVLHCSPEPELKLYINNIKKRLEINYKTADIVRGQDLLMDITKIQFPDNSFDIVICHRVLEHILDDIEALKEFFRILAPKGFLSISVPQSMHRETLEWLVPDKTHDFHVRHYGKDFVEKICNVGFRVELNRALLDKSLSQHKEDNTYPMRIYNCFKD